MLADGVGVMSTLCLSCPLPDCDDESPACQLRIAERAHIAAQVRRYRSNPSPLAAAMRHVIASSCMRVARAERDVRVALGELV